MLVHRITSYNKKALWDAVKAWFEGGPPASGAIDPEGAVVHAFSGRGGATWRIYAPDVPKEERAPLAWSSFATPLALDANTFGYRWNRQLAAQSDSQGWFAGDSARVLSPGDESESEGRVGSGACRRRAGRNRPGGVRLSSPAQGPRRTLCHARGADELLEEARSRGRAVPAHAWATAAW